MMDIKDIDMWIQQTGTDLDFVLALEDYLNLYDTSLSAFLQWKHKEDALTPAEYIDRYDP